MKKQKLICYAIIAATIQSIMAAPARQWSPEQATGAPDTNTAGDLPTAWASMNPDAGPEWLQVEFAKPTEIAEVRIRETFNPGAINKVEAISADNKGTVIWEGTAEAKPAPSDMVVKPQSAVVSNKIKIHLDTTRVPGWNEIDAVELLGKDGSRQWAQAATASTTYADAQPQQPGQKIPQAAQPQQYNLQELIGENLVDAEGKPVDPISLKGKMVGIYFSAQWCPPCRLFTPKLVEFRNKIAKDFEVVFVSSDRDEASMRAYMKEAGMPWPALPFGLEKKAALSKTFEIRGIPSLVVLNENGLRISGNPRNDVSSLGPEVALEKWKKNI
jgi:thiol-disulfide isomerase/thioredoxin